MPHPVRFPQTAQTVPADYSGMDCRRFEVGARTFAGAQLQQADFRGMNLRGVSFRAADARGANFDAADLRAADFTGALVQGARFRRAGLQEASFRQALLLSAHLEHASVQGASFAGANLEWAWLEGVDFARAIVSCALFHNVRGLSEAARAVIEKGGGLTGDRAMILGRELYEQPPTDAGQGRPGAWPYG